MTTAWTAEQAHATSSAPLAAAIPAAWASPQLGAEPVTGPLWGDRAANAARSAAVCAAALAPASAPMSTATSPAISTKPASANPTRVAPPCSPSGRPREPASADRAASAMGPMGLTELVEGRGSSIRGPVRIGRRDQGPHRSGDRGPHRSGLGVGRVRGGLQATALISSGRAPKGRVRGSPTETRTRLGSVAMTVILAGRPGGSAARAAAAAGLRRRRPRPPGRPREPHPGRGRGRAPPRGGSPWPG